MAARVSQVVVEALLLPDDVSARVSQVTVEALILPDDVSARVSQFVVEVLVRPLAPTGGVIPDVTAGPPMGAPWNQGKVFVQEHAYPFGAAPEPSIQSLMAPEYVLGPPIAGSPWRHGRLPHDEASTVYGPPAPFVPSPPAYAPEIGIGYGPPMLGAPWMVRIPASEAPWTLGEAVLPGDPDSPVATAASRVQFIPRVPDLRDTRRLNRFTELVSDVMNSLIRKGQLSLEGLNDWNISGGDYDGGTF